MAVNKRPEINNIPYEEFQDNETLERLVQELNENGVGVMVGALDTLIDWGRSNSLWPLTFATSCCGIEFMAVAAARYDMARFGFEITRNSPRQADVILVNDHQQNGARFVASLQPDARPEIRGGHRRLRHFWRSVHEELSRGERCRQGDPRRRICARLPSAP